MMKGVAGMPLKEQDYQTPQAREFASLIGELVGKIDKRFSDLDGKVQARFVEQAKEIARLDDDVNNVASRWGRRFQELADSYVAGDGPYRGSYKGPYHSPEAARAAGTAFAALAGAPWAREAWEKESSRFAAAMQALPGSQGGFLMPEVLLGGIINNAEQHGVFQQNARNWDVDGESATRVTKAEGATVYYPDFGVAPNESNLKVGRVRTELPKHAVLAFADRWMLSHSNLAIALGDFIASELAYALAVATDTNAFMGDGSVSHAKVTGLFKQTLGADVTADDGDDTGQEIVDKSTYYLSKIVGAIPDVADDGDLRFYLHRATFWHYLGVQDSQKRPIADILMKGERPQRVLVGYPAEMVQVAPKPGSVGASSPILLLANLARGAELYRNSGGARMFISEHVRLLQGEVCFLLEVLQGYAVVDKSVMGRLVTAAS